jgi:hypothetical protein
MLPKIQYVSMMLDSETDISSGDVDALAMKYLTDEQLAELAHLRTVSPKKHSVDRRDPVLDRVMARSPSCNSTSRSGSSTPSQNYMSFATKNYLQKYGLIESEVNSADQTFNDTRNTDSTENGLNVRDFLNILAEQSFHLSRSMSEGDQAQSMNERTPEGSMYGHHLGAGDGYGAKQSPALSGGNVDHHRQENMTSDTTAYYSPACSPYIGPQLQKKPPQRAASDTSPSKQRHKREPVRETPPHTPNTRRNVFTNSPPEDKPMGRILDIDRLRELPKLL